MIKNCIMNETAIVTGASGFIGSRLILRLLQAGWQVVALGRSKASHPWDHRGIAALTTITGHPQPPELLARLSWQETDSTRPDLALGLDPAATLGISGAVLFHVAGDTRFTPQDVEAQRQINVTGSCHVLRGLRPCLRHAVHVSTAYVAGNRTGRVMETERDLGQITRNPYERSKLDAESAVIALARELELPLAITRPSIITNDTRTGRSSTFTHFNALVDVVHRIQSHYGLHDGETVSDVIRLPMNPDCRPNLAPVDPIVDALFEIGIHPDAPGHTFHLCHPSPQANRDVLGLVAQAFGVQNKLRLEFVPEVPIHPTWTERMIIRSFKPYLPYLNESCTFDLTQTRRLIPNYDDRFGPVTTDYIHKVIDFQRQQRAQEME